MNFKLASNQQTYLFNNVGLLIQVYNLNRIPVKMEVNLTDILSRINLKLNNFTSEDNITADAPSHLKMIRRNIAQSSDAYQEMRTNKLKQQQASQQVLKNMSMKSENYGKNQKNMTYTKPNAEQQQNYKVYANKNKNLKYGQFRSSRSYDKIDSSNIKLNPNDEDDDSPQYKYQQKMGVGITNLRNSQGIDKHQQTFLSLKKRNKALQNNVKKLQDKIKSLEQGMQMSKYNSKDQKNYNKSLANHKLRNKCNNKSEKSMGINNLNEQKLGVSKKQRNLNKINEFSQKGLKKVALTKNNKPAYPIKIQLKNTSQNKCQKTMNTKQRQLKLSRSTQKKFQNQCVKNETSLHYITFTDQLNKNGNKQKQTLPKLKKQQNIQKYQTDKDEKIGNQKIKKIIMNKSQDFKPNIRYNQVTQASKYVSSNIQRINLSNAQNKRGGQKQGKELQKIQEKTLNRCQSNKALGLRTLATTNPSSEQLIHNKKSGNLKNQNWDSQKIQINQSIKSSYLRPAAKKVDEQFQGLLKQKQKLKQKHKTKQSQRQIQASKQKQRQSDNHENMVINNSNNLKRYLKKQKNNKVSKQSHTKLTNNYISSHLYQN